MKLKKVFVDSDVIISSLISTKGAAYYLLNNTDLNFIISDKSVEELEVVVTRLGLNKKKLNDLIKAKINVIKLGKPKSDVQSYVIDPNDIHILAGSKKAKARFLISYNIRDFKIDKIAEDFKIVVLTPAKFLQYLRGLQ